MVSHTVANDENEGKGVYWQIILINPVLLFNTNAYPQT